MPSEIDVCNEALMMLGDDPIMSMEDGIPRSWLCKLFYPITRDDVMGSHNWRCLSRRVQLAQLAEVPPFDYAHYYQIPVDCLKIIRTDLDDDGYDWKREGSRIATDEATVYLEYVQRVTDPVLWPPKLREAIALHLAEKICTGVGKGDRKNDIKQDYEYTLSIAQFIDATEGKPEETSNTQLTEVR